MSGAGLGPALWVAFLVTFAILAGPLERVQAKGPEWRATIAPSTLRDGRSSEVRLTVVTPGPEGERDAIECVTVDVPRSFAVQEVRAIALPHRLDAWVAAAELQSDGSTHVTFRQRHGEPKGRDRAERATFGITVKPRDPGASTWRARAFNNEGCRENALEPIALTLTVAVASNPRPAETPAPRATKPPRPAPRPAETPAPRATKPPRPAETPAPRATKPPRPAETPAPASPGAQAALPADPSAPPTAIPNQGAVSLSEPDSGRPDPARPRRADRIVVAGAGPDSGPPVHAEVALVGSFGAGLEFLVPSFAVSVPGLLILLAVGVQLAGGAAWLPVVRRRLGEFGLFTRRRIR
jgi:hypothetical protein